MAANDIGDLRQSVDRLASDMRDRFDQVDQRFGQGDQRFDQMDQRFGQMDQRFERLEAQIHAESAETREYVNLAEHETRRHIDVVAEGMEERFKSLALSISANRESIGRLGRRVERLERDSR